MGLGMAPGIAQLVPGDNGADEHTEAHGPLHVRAAVGKLWPAGQIRPVWLLYPAPRSQESRPYPFT